MVQLARRPSGEVDLNATAAAAAAALAIPLARVNATLLEGETSLLLTIGAAPPPPPPSGTSLIVTTVPPPSSLLAAQNLATLLSSTSDEGKQLRTGLAASLGSAPVARATVGLVVASTCHEAAHLYTMGVQVGRGLG